MRAEFLTLFIGVAYVPFCACAADDNSTPAPGATAEVRPAAAAKLSVPAAGMVTRAFFTSDIKNHEPVNDIATLSNDKTHIAYFTEIQDMAGQVVTHRWEYNGQIMFEMPFQVRASRWRVYSTKTLDPVWLGEWKASVVDAAGGSLSVNTFSYLKTANVAPAPARSSPVTSVPTSPQP